MTDNRKTLVAAAVLAASVGVYLEISYEQKLKTAPPATSRAPSASAATSALPPSSAPKAR